LRSDIRPWYIDVAVKVSLKVAYKRREKK